MLITNATDAATYLATFAYPGAGFEAPSDATVIDLLGRTIASRYAYIEAWRGRGLTADGEADMLEAIGVLRLGFYRLAGRAYIN